MYREFLEYQPYAMSKFNKEGDCLFSNSKELEFRDLSTTSLTSIYDNFSDDEIIELKKTIKKSQDTKEEAFFEYQRKNKFYKVRVVLDNEENIITTSSNITYEKKLEHDALEEKENIKRFDDAIKGANIGFWDFFPQEEKIIANKTWVTQKNYKSKDFRKDDALFSEIIDGLNKWASLVHPDDLEPTIKLIQKHLDGETSMYEAEFRMKCGDGSWKWIYDLGRVFQHDENGNAYRMNGVHIDITKLKNLQMEVESLKEEYKLKSRIDLLTSIYNKDYFIELAPSLLELSKENKETCSLLFLDLDHFKKINDSYGHLVGDEVLKETVNQINSCIREGDVLARFGGEEFVLLLPSTNEEKALHLAERIRLTLNNKILKTNNIEIKVSISIGLTSTKNDNYDLNELLKNSDNALYLAKNSGRNNTKVFS